MCLIGCNEEYSIASGIFLPKDTQPESNQEKTSDKLTLRSFVKSNSAVIFKSIKVMKVKEK